MTPTDPPDPGPAAAVVPPAGAVERKKTMRLVTALWLASILLGAAHGWVGRHSMNPDGVTYMDISDAYRGGHWKAALNSYRSPLYSWMLAPALALTQASPGAEFAAVHAVNCLIFLAALGCFHFLLTGVIRIHPESAFPNWALAGAAYALFLWSTLILISLELVTPDLCVAAVVYAATGVLLRIRKGDDRWAVFLVLGLILGIGYLSKVALLAFAPLIAILCAVAIGNLRQAMPRVILMAFGFVVVAGPWIYTLSNAEGRLSFGDAATLNLAYMQQGVPMVHWHGGPPGSGVPVHPDHQIFSHPDAYGFASPISGTYPPSYDFSYWAEGVIVRPQAGAILRRLARSFREYFTFFDERLSGVISILVLLWLIGVRGPSVLGNLAQEWRLLIPAFYGFGLYAPVWVDWRYLGAYVTLLWIALLCSPRIPEFGRRHQITGAAAVAIMVVLGLHICDFSYTKIRQSDPMAEHLEVARSLRAQGIGPGSPVANIGDSHVAFWARLARVRIVAEIPLNLTDPAIFRPDITEVDIFWAARAEVKAAVMRKFAETGAKAVIARDVPPAPAGSGWQNIVGTPYSLYRLH